MKTSLSHRLLCLLATWVLGGMGLAQQTDLPMINIDSNNRQMGVKEGEGSVAARVWLVKSSSSPVTVTAEVKSAATTADAGDFTLETSTLTFAPGEVEKTLRLSITDDAVVESLEQVVIELVSATGARLPEPGSAYDASLTLTITDNDEKPYVALTRQEVIVTEGQPTLRLMAQLSWPSAQRIVVPFMVEDDATASLGEATIPEDLGPLPQAVVFEPGETLAEIAVPITDDAVEEAQEEITLELCVPGSIIEVGVGILIGGPLIPITVDPANLPFRLNVGEAYATCRIVINDDDSLATSPSPRATRWQNASPNASSQTLRAITWTGTQYIAVGDFGTILTSPDGDAWTLRDSGVRAGLSSVAWSGSEAVAVGSGVALRSQDGLTWEVQSRARGSFGMVSVVPQAAAAFVPQGGGSWFEGAASVCWTGQRFVVVSQYGAIATSTDGRVWQRQATNDYSRTVTDLDVVGGQLMAPALGNPLGVPYYYSQKQACLLTSTDGLDWTRRTTSLPLFNELYYLFGRTLILISEEPTSAALPNMSLRLAHRPDAPAGEASWVMAQRGGSNDGLWASSESAPFASDEPQRVLNASGYEQVLWTGSQWVAVGKNLATSLDGSTWTEQERLGQPVLHGLVRGGGKTLAVGDSGAIQLIPEPRSSPALRSFVTMSQSMKDVAWVGDQYVAVGAEGVIFTSPDGHAWTARDSGTQATLHAIASHGIISGSQGAQAWLSRAVIIVVGEAGTVLVSYDSGVTWAAATSGTQRALRGVTWQPSGIGTVDGQFVAVGDERVVLTSPDGQTWTARALPQLPPVTAQTLGLGAASLVASTSIAYPIYSYQPDEGEVTPANALEDVTWTGSQFVAVGAQDSIFTSPDGVAWTQRSVSHTPRPLGNGFVYFYGWTANPVADLKRVLWTGSQLIATGAFGSVLTSTDGVDWKDQNTGLYTDYPGYPYVTFNTGGPVAASSASLQVSSSASLTTASVSTTATLSGSMNLTKSSLSILRPYFYQRTECLRGLAVAAGDVLAVGSFGQVLSSPDGQAWASRQPAMLLPMGQTLQNLNAVACHDGQTVAVGDHGQIVVNDPAPLRVPSLHWSQTSQTVDENVGNVTVTAYLSAALASDLDVPFSTIGGAGSTALADYVSTGSGYQNDYLLEGGQNNGSTASGTLHFPAGSTTASLTLTINDDTQEEPEENILLRLGLPQQSRSALPWLADEANVIIRGSDQRPRILTETGDAVIAVGDEVTFGVTATTATGTLRYQWHKQDSSGSYQPLTGETNARLTIIATDAAATASPHYYSVTVSNGLGQAQSYFTLVVVPAGQGGAITAFEGDSVTLALARQAPPLSSQVISLNNIWPEWLRDGDFLPYHGEVYLLPDGSTSWRWVPQDTRYRHGSDDRRNLVISDAQQRDTGRFTCRLQLPQIAYLSITNHSIIAWPPYRYYYPVREAPRALDIHFDLTVQPAPVPEVAAIPPQLGMVSRPFTLALSATRSPTSFAVQGLPEGLELDPSTGIISGAPAVAGSYRVEVTATNRTGNSAIVTFYMDVLPLIPVPTLFAPSTWSVPLGEPVEFHVSGLNVYSYAASGLPVGMRLNTQSGLISGRPTQVGHSTVTLTASNMAGTSAPVTFEFTVEAPNLADVAATYTMLARSHSGHQHDGRLDFIVTLNGKVTGKLTRGNSSRPFTSTVTQDEFGALRVLANLGSGSAGGPISLVVNLSQFVQPISGTLSQGAVELAGLNGWRRGWTRDVPVFAGIDGYYSAVLGQAEAIAPNTLGTAAPRGQGFLTYTVQTDGSFTLKGRTSDGSAFTQSSFIGQGEQISVYHSLDAQGSQIIGEVPLIVLDNNVSQRRLSGSLSWFKAARRSSDVATDMTVTVKGGRYISTRAQPVPGLTLPAAVTLTLSEGGLAQPVAVALRLTARGTATVVGRNDAKVWLLFDPKSGVLNGGFMPSGRNARRTSFQGQMALGEDGFLGGAWFDAASGVGSGSVKLEVTR